jgi:hypothetical protein
MNDKETKGAATDTVPPDLHLSDFHHHYDAFNVRSFNRFDFDYRDFTAVPPAICYAAGGSLTTEI